MAVVYRAHDEALKREVAIKVLHPHLLTETQSKVRLEREAQAVAKLHHDNIVQVFDYSGEDPAASFIVTEFVDGRTLRQFLAGRPTPAPEVAALMVLEIGGALEHAHALGILHRDVKPENVMVRRDGVLKLMDFGVAQVMDLERMTVTGQLLGSPAYMAPEILEGQSLDARTDVFSVGVMLYQLCTGALPFSGRNPAEVMKRVSDGKYTDPRTVNRQVADPLARIIARALARRPEDRYPGMEPLLADLRAFVTDAGLENTTAELKAYFCTPETYEATIKPRTLAALVARGKTEREAGRTARALELWNRALGIDPADKDVLFELKRLESRLHWKRASVAAACAVALGFGGFFALTRAGVSGAEGTGGLAEEKTPPVSLTKTLDTPPDPARPDEAVTPPTAKQEAVVDDEGVAVGANEEMQAEPARVPTGMPTASADEEPNSAEQATGSAEGRAQKERLGKPANAARTARKFEPAGGAAEAVQGRAAPRARNAKRLAVLKPEPTTFDIAPWPVRNVNIFVDGELWGEFGEKTTVELDMTREHELRFTSPCCPDVVERVGPKSVYPNNRIWVPFKGKPAILTVRTNPAFKGKVGIFEKDPDDGAQPFKTTDRLGQRVHIPFADDRNMAKTLVLVLDIEGRPEENHEVLVHAGGNHSPVLELAP